MNKSKSFYIVILISIFLLVLSSCYYISNIISKSVKINNQNNSGLISKTHKISGVSEDNVELFKLIGFKDKNLWNDSIIKTKDNRFWFFAADDKGCGRGLSCTAPSYMIDTEKKTISNFAKSDVNQLTLIPFHESSVITYTEPENDTYRMVVLDPSTDMIVDYIDYPTSGENNEIIPYQNFLFVSNKYYLYSYKNILYSRNVENHTSFRIGNFYDPKVIGVDDMELPLILSGDGKTIFTLIYVNDDDSRPYTENFFFKDPVPPKKSDPLNLIAFNVEDNSTKIISKQNFNYPFVFKFVAQNEVLIGGGSGGHDLKTFLSYLVDVITGKTDLVFNGETDSIKVNEVDNTIIINDTNKIQIKDIKTNFAPEDVDLFSTYGDKDK